MDADSLSRRPHETSFHVPLDQELLNQFREQHTPGPGAVTYSVKGNSTPSCIV